MAPSVSSLKHLVYDAVAVSPSPRYVRFYVCIPTRHDMQSTLACSLSTIIMRKPP